MRAVRVLWQGALAVGVAVGLWGCQGYGSYPGPESSAMITNPNTRGTVAVVTEAVRWASLRYAPGGDVRASYLVSPPAGMWERYAERIADSLGDRAVLLREGDESLPTFSVGRVWLRGSRAKVDVFRPVVELGRDDNGAYTLEPVTVWLEGGIEPWRVVRHQTWAIGSVELPNAWYAPRPGFERSEVVEVPVPADDGP